VPACNAPKHSRIEIAPEVRKNEEIQVAGRPDLGVPVIAGDEKERDSAIVSHATMKKYASSATSTAAMLARKAW